MQIDISKIEDTFKIQTDSGYKDVSAVFTKEEECLELHLSNWEIIKVAKNHLFEVSPAVWRFASELKVHDKIISKTGFVNIVNILDIGVQTVYDLTVDTTKHQYYANGLSSHNSGKTLLAIASGMKLIDDKQYDKIIYIRNSVESVDKAEEVGFLPGLESKFEIYNFPLYDTLEFISQNEVKTFLKTGKQPQSKSYSPEQLKEKYKIETMWNGAIRGRTLSRAFVIIDEAQNFSKKSLQTVVTRLDKDCKLILIGSNRQIDHPYITKLTNGLSVILNSMDSPENEVTLFGTELNKVVRGKITAYAERIFEK